MQIQDSDGVILAQGTSMGAHKIALWNATDAGKIYRSQI